MHIEKNNPSISDRVLLVVLCGWPLSGKSILGNNLSSRLGIQHLDINDNIRVPVFGPPQVDLERYEMFRTRDEEEMRASYELLMHAAELHLRLNRSVIISATFSRVGSQEALRSVYEKCPGAKVRIIWCRPTNYTEEEILRRLSVRQAMVNRARACGHTPYVDPSNSVERCIEVKSRFETILLPHFQLDTSAPYTIAESIDSALAYVLS